MSEIEVPKGWSVLKIKDISELINGRAFKPEDWKKNGLPIIRIQNLNDPTKSFNYYDSKVDDKYLIDHGDLLFAWSGTPGTSFGAHIWKGGKAILNQHIYHVKNKEEIIDKNYLKYALNKNLEEYIGKAHGGAGLRHITKGKLEDSKILLPTLNIQKKIVQKLDHILGQLEEKKKQIISRIEKFDAKKINQNYKNHLLKLAFDGTLTNEEPGEIIDGIQVPKGWRLEPFAKIRTSFDGLRIPLNKSQRSQIQGQYPYYGASGQVDSINDYKFDGRYLLIAEDGENLNSHKKPIAFIVEGKFWVNNHAHVVQTTSDLDLDYLCYYFNGLRIMNYAQKQATRPKLNKSDLDKIPICFPKSETQKKIVHILDKKFTDWENHKQELEHIQNQHDLIKKHLNSLSSSILNDAFSGKLVN